MGQNLADKAIARNVIPMSSLVTGPHFFLYTLLIRM